ncbi:hypothetical protein [Paludisphaera mucosa]|uniref:Uncharacterized protein n=1 Tax=Paludisphaera mucosa TaxID=3030827 RepID=A0ABT6FH76_9BACT|nr:hypothetical protein [Paludisphaera mucosa]MDG3006938.1 hypothetical protein [Paludisphaera mucosa]
MPEAVVETPATTALAGARMPEEDPAAWPPWARRLATVALALHIAAVAGGAMGVPPSSPLERRFADLFTWHHGLFDQGYAYRYYAEPPPTPVVVATLHRADGGPDESVRIPARESVGPPMRRQRQLALANALFAGTRAVHRDEEGEPHESWLARSYARHLGRTHPGTSSVTLRVQQHLMPAPDRVLDSMRESDGRFDLFDESLFTTPRWIGDFPCDGF